MHHCSLLYTNKENEVKIYLDFTGEDARQKCNDVLAEVRLKTWYCSIEDSNCFEWDDESGNHKDYRLQGFKLAKDKNEFIKVINDNRYLSGWDIARYICCTKVECDWDCDRLQCFSYLVLAEWMDRNWHKSNHRIEENVICGDEYPEFQTIAEGLCKYGYTGRTPIESSIIEPLKDETLKRLHDEGFTSVADDITEKCKDIPTDTMIQKLSGSESPWYITDKFYVIFDESILSYYRMWKK